MTRVQDFDREIENQCGIMYNMRTRGELLKFQKKLITAVKHAKKGMEQAGSARGKLSPHESHARITKANARYHTAAEQFERQSKHLAYVCAMLAPPSHDALFDGSNAHMLNDAGDAFEPDNAEVKGDNQ
jgi:hypothetical protein